MTRTLLALSIAALALLQTGPIIIQGGSSPGPSGATLEETGAINKSTTTSNVPAAMTITSGNYVIVFCAHDGGTGTVTSVADGCGGGTYTQLTQSGGSGRVNGIWHSGTSASGSCTVTVTLSTSQDSTCVVTEWSGLDDGAITGTGTSGFGSTIASQSVDPVGTSNVLYLGITTHTNGVLRTIDVDTTPPVWTEIAKDESVGAGNTPISTSYNVATGAADQARFNMSANASFAVGIATFGPSS